MVIDAGTFPFEQDLAPVNKMLFLTDGRKSIPGVPIKLSSKLAR